MERRGKARDQGRSTGGSGIGGAEEEKVEAGGETVRGKWYLEGFGTGPGNTKLVVNT